MAIAIFDKKIFEKEIGKVDDKMENKISSFGTPVEEINENEIHVEVFPNRPDLISYHGFKRAFMAFLGKGKGVKNYKVKDPEKNFIVNVNSSLKNVRPFTVCAVVKNLKLNDERIKEIIDVQEKLHFTIGRKRKKIAIGIYPLDKIKFPISFKAIEPKEIKFMPIDSEKEMSGLEILKKHPPGIEYAHLLKGYDKFPVFVDSDKNVLSMPPITNSEFAGRVSTGTKDVFVECSGFDLESLKKCLNILSTMLSDMGGQIYQVEVRLGGKKEITPNLENESMKISLENVNKLLGLELNEKKMKELVERMGYNYKNKMVEIAPWRTDVLHEVDIIEDIAIAYGYDNFVPEIPEISTIGDESRKDRLKKTLSEILAGLGMLGVSNYHLSTKEDQFKKMGIVKKDFLELEASKTEYKILRKDLSHYLMKILSENTDSHYPQKIFEVGKVFDSGGKNRVSECESLGIAVSPGNFTEMKQIVEYLFRIVDVKISVKEPSDDESPKYFINGRTAKIVLNNKEVGFFGEIHPRILRNWKIKMPVALCEIKLDEVLNLMS